MQDDQPDFSSSEPVVPAGSPLWPRHLLDLFIAPVRFFSSQLALGKTPYLIPLLYLFGVAATLDRLELRVQQTLVRIELGTTPPVWKFLEPFASNWLYFWGYGLFAGLVSAAFIWWIGGWWFKVRTAWSGAVNPDARKARLVYVYAATVWTIPYVAHLVAGSLVYDNYLTWWEAGTPWDLLLLLFPFWSAVAGYKGVITVFEVSRGRALIWFLLLPSLLYLITFGALGALHFMGSSPGSG